MSKPAWWRRVNVGSMLITSALGWAIAAAVWPALAPAPVYVTCVLPQPRSSALHFVWKTTKPEIRDGVLETPDGAYRLLAGEMCLFDTEPPAVQPAPKDQPASVPVI